MKIFHRFEKVVIAVLLVGMVVGLLVSSSTVSAEPKPTQPPKNTPTPVKPTVPPKTSPQPTPQDTTPSPDPNSTPFPGGEGGTIELLAGLPSSGTVRLREVFTVVQWQDGNGDWHDVEGWRGQPDNIVGRTALKTWWVSEDDLGTGPFRWRVFWDVYVDVSPSTARVMDSSPFYLPDAGRTVVVEMSTRRTVRQGRSAVE
jgi:hypothetical protein